MSKKDQILAVLKTGEHSVVEIAEKTGFPSNLISVYLSQYSKAWGVTKTGLRKSYRYGIGATQGSGEASQAAPVADQPGGG